ncbi:MAG: histidinol-phosphate transaminase [Peptostreptococcaceae bacterium]
MSTNHGANLYDLSNKLGLNKKELMDFSSNINPLGSSILAKQAVIDNIDMVSIYPDPSYQKLKHAISDYCNCSMSNILLGSGATELISSFTDIVNPKKAVLLSPSYSEYEKELNKVNCDVHKYFSTKENLFKVDINDFIKFINSDNHDMVIICNPNNPTGFAFSNTQIRYILENTNTFIMIDETYIEFSDTSIYSSTNLVDEFNKLFVIRGTSKFFGTPGIRLGYGLTSNEKIKEAINTKIDLWNINTLASIMGEVMFNDKNFINTASNTLKSERDYLLNELSCIKDFRVYHSDGNFILSEITSKKLTASALRDMLIEKHIIIRDCKSFEGLDEYFFRVCTLDHNQNKLLIESLKSIF